MHVMGMGYALLGAQSLDGWFDFAGNALGLECVQYDDRPDRLYLRLDDCHHRFMIDVGDTEGVLAIGWEVKSRTHLQAAIDELEAAGFPCRMGDPDEAKARYVRGFCSFTDPAGLRHELYHGLAHHDGAFRPGRAHAGFVTGDQGLGHAVANVSKASFEAEHRFYSETLGFTNSIYGTVAMTGEFAAFYRCNPRQHCFAIIANDTLGTHHIMIEAAHLDDVGIAYDRIRAAGYTLISELGRHSGDNMVSFYVETPSGVFFEYGWGGRRVDDEEIEGDHFWFGSPGIWGHKWVGARSPRTIVPVKS